MANTATTTMGMITTTTTTTSTTTSTPTTADTTNGPKYASFLDDPFHMATYVVLPVMIVVYGGCCFIYCMAKLHRYCKRRARRRAKRLLIQKDSNHNDSVFDRCKSAKSRNSNDHHNPAAADVMTVTDMTEPEPAVPVVKPVEPSAPYSPVPPEPVKTSRPESRKPSGDTSSAHPKRAEYANTLQEQMKHLDDQLKTAFRLITDEPKKPKSRPDVCAKTHENSKPLKRRTESKMHFFVSDQ